MSSSARPPYRLDPAKARQHIARIDRFRILIMGRANAGKTTILQRVCNAKDTPEIYNALGQKVDTTVVQGSLMRGHHNVEDELVFASNSRFVFHDSCGLEARSRKEFEMIKDFVMHRAKMTKLEKRIHAIWFCIPLSERHRMVMGAEKMFFDHCDRGHVPVIVLLTKADLLSLDAFQEVEELMENGESIDDVRQCAVEVEGRLLNNSLLMVKERLNELRFPPQHYLTLTGMNQESADCTSLLTFTTRVLSEGGMQQLIVSTQQSNMELCMEFSIMKGLKMCMKKEESKMGPNALASLLALWFPYKQGAAAVVEAAAEERANEAAKAAAAFKVAKAFFETDRRGAAAARREAEEQFTAAAARKAAEFERTELVDYNLLGDIQQSLSFFKMPALSTSIQYSIQYTAEQGIGTVLVLEYLYFLLQVVDGRLDFQEFLDLAVEEYETSNTRASVCKLIKEAFQCHGANMDILCPVLVEVAKENQMSRELNRKG